MKVYIESVLLLNFLLDFMILYGTGFLLKRKRIFKRIFFSSLLGSFTIFLLFVSIHTMELFFIKIFLSFLMNFIAFGRSKLFENTFYFYLLSIILGGSILLLDLQHCVYLHMLILLLLCPMILSFVIHQYRKYKEYHLRSYQVKIVYLDQEYLFDGFIDTGNHLKSPISHRPVILIDQYIPHQTPYYIPYKALNFEGILECMRPDKVLIDEVEIKKCLVGLSKYPLSSHCILPNCIKEEL